MTCSMCQSNKPLNGHCSHRDGGVTYSSLSSFLSRLKIYYYCSHTQHIDIFYLIFSGGVGGLFAFVDLWIFWFSCGNVCGLSGNFVIRSVQKQASYAPLMGSLHAKCLPGHNASNMLIITISLKSGNEIDILLRIVAVVRSWKHARRSV